MCHINLKDCVVCDSIQAKEVDLCHIPGDINPSGIFTKEMRKTAHFCTLRESFMMSADKLCAIATSVFVWMSASLVSGINMATPAA